MKKYDHKRFSNVSIIIVFNLNLFSFPEKYTIKRGDNLTNIFFTVSINKIVIDKVYTLGTCSTLTDLKLLFSSTASLQRFLKFGLLTFQEPSNSCKTNNNTMVNSLENTDQTNHYIWTLYIKQLGRIWIKRILTLLLMQKPCSNNYNISKHHVIFWEPRSTHRKTHKQLEFQIIL